jgi:hypothetical protein
VPTVGVEDMLPPDTEGVSDGEAEPPIDRAGDADCVAHGGGVALDDTVGEVDADQDSHASTDGRVHTTLAHALPLFFQLRGELMKKSPTEKQSTSIDSANPLHSS